MRIVWVDLETVHIWTPAKIGLQEVWVMSVAFALSHSSMFLMFVSSLGCMQWTCYAIGLEYQKALQMAHNSKGSRKGGQEVSL